MHHRGKSTFGVTGTTAEKASIAISGLKRRNGHAFDRNRIHVGFQHHTSLRIDTRQASNHVEAVRKNWLPEGFNALSFKKELDIFCDLPLRTTLFVGRVNAID